MAKKMDFELRMSKGKALMVNKATGKVDKKRTAFIRKKA
jgi:hypothetical protein